MDREIGTRWADALESGRFKKGKATLHRLAGKAADIGNDEFCCLGVLCLLGMEAGIELEAKVREGAHARVAYDGNAVSLPSRIRDWAGMKNSYGGIPWNREGLEDLTTLNDRNDTWGPVVAAIRRHMADL